MSSYRLIRLHSGADQTDVSNLIDEGWKLHGLPVANDVGVYQAVIKEDDVPTGDDEDAD